MAMTGAARDARVAFVISCCVCCVAAALLPALPGSLPMTCVTTMATSHSPRRVVLNAGRLSAERRLRKGEATEVSFSVGRAGRGR
jgi:hypothetical protein